MRVGERHLMLGVSRWFVEIFRTTKPMYILKDTNPVAIFKAMESADGQVHLSTLIERLAINEHPPAVGLCDLFRPHNLSWEQWMLTNAKISHCVCEVCLITRASFRTVDFGTSGFFGFGGDLLRAILVPAGIPEIEMWLGSTLLFTKKVDHTRRVLLTPTEMVPVPTLWPYMYKGAFRIKPNLHTREDSERSYRYEYILLNTLTRDKMRFDMHLGIYDKYKPRFDDEHKKMGLRQITNWVVGN